jgi:hypothetical protein
MYDTEVPEADKIDDVKSQYANDRPLLFLSSAWNPLVPPLFQTVPQSAGGAISLAAAYSTSSSCPPQKTQTSPVPAAVSCSKPSAEGNAVSLSAHPLLDHQPQ